MRESGREGGRGGSKEGGMIPSLHWLVTHTVEYVSSVHGRGTLGCSGRGGWALNTCM